MQQMMRQMGIQQVELDDVERVEIICADKKVVIEPASVSKVNMMGQESWQVSGESREESLDAAVEISEEDVTTVAEQANVSLDEAQAALEAANGDLAEAILKLKKG